MGISAVILCGGRATRMGGLDKGLVDYQGKLLVHHVISLIQPQVDELLINANREILHYESFGFPVFQDTHPDFIGPLAGFYVGLTQAKYDFLMTVPCDTPHLPDNLCQRLYQALIIEHADIAVAQSDGAAHPVISLCKTSVLSALTEAIERGERKVSTWQKSLAYTEVNFDDCAHAFANLNTLQDLNRLDQDA